MATTDGQFEAKLPATIYYSNDAGKSYSKIYTGPLPAAAESIEQITSALFSTDGTAIVFGDLPQTDGKNTVKEIDIKAKSVKDLFTKPDLTGVFIKGYDVANKKLLYLTGCYNCDGSNTGKLYSRDLTSGLDTIIYVAPKASTALQTVLKSDFTKLLVVHGVSGDALGAGAPYTVEEYDFAAKTSTQLAQITGETSAIAGYSTADVPYYVQSNTLYAVVAGGKPTTLFEAASPIIAVSYVGADTLVLSAGKYDNYQLTSYSISTKKTVKIFDGDGSTNLLGVTQQ